MTRRLPGRSRSARTGRAELALTAAFLLVVTALFVVAAVVSYQALRSGQADEASSLPPLAVEGPEETVFDYTQDACSPIDIPDAPARAFRDAQDRVHLIASHYVTRAMTGPTLDEVRHDCRLVMKSDLDADPARFSDREWITSPWTPDGRTVYALVHNEHQGDKHAGQCPSGVYLKCWYNSITLARSSDGGRTFRQPPPPRHLIAAVPYRYQPDAGPVGIFQPSNVVHRTDDGHWYALVHSAAFGEQREGTCVMRTATLDDPRSWRAWDGVAYRVRFANPYESSGTGGHICSPVAFEDIVGMTHSLTYNTYLDKYVLVSPAGRDGPGRGGAVWGFYYSTSDDLIDWSPRRLIREVTLTTSFECGDPNPAFFPSLLDPDSPSRNFETTGRRPYLYFTRFHYKDCNSTLNRDLVRVRVRFSK